MRLQEIIEESTVAGSVATVAMPLGTIQSRGPIGKGVYDRPREYANSAAKKSKSRRSIKEEYSRDEYDKEGEMAQSQARTIADAAQELQRMLNDAENLPEWVQKKITLAQDYIDTARDYLKANRPQTSTISQD